MSGRKRSSRPQVCVLGLDGMPHSLLQGLAQRGVMPCCARLLTTGAFRRMRVTLPEISAVSWSSFMTGANPGVHGIFGFTDVDAQYRLRFPSFLDLRAPTIWDRLGQVGKRSVVIGQPATYPARPLRGVLVSGFVAVDFAQAVYPPARRADLERIGYRVDVDLTQCRQDSRFLLQEINQVLEVRSRAVELLWEEEWDYFEVVAIGADRLQHMLWEAVENPEHKLHPQAMDYYRHLDAFIGAVADRCSSRGVRLYLLSDHGFTGIRQEVAVNAWLREHGWLSFATERPDGLERLADGSRAFALDPGRIYLNRVGRFARGTVGKADVKAVKADLQAALQGLTCNGEPVLCRVFDSEQIYHGPELAAAPDLVLLSRPGFDLKATLRQRQVFGRSGLTGMHTWDDAFLLAPRELPEEVDICLPYRLLLEDLGVRP